MDRSRPCISANGDILPQHLGIQFLGLEIEARESALAMRDIQPTIASALHGTEGTGTSRGPVKPNIQVGLEGTSYLPINIS